MEEDVLEKGLLALGFTAEGGTYGPCGVRPLGEIIRLTNAYIRELELFNAVFDLVGANNRQDLVVRHILDSLSPWKVIADTLAELQDSGKPVSMADAGSGAGFPGLPLAIIFNTIDITLIERMSKRCAFLENCIAMLGLSGVKVLNCEIEKAPRAAFGLVVFRAFRPLDAAMTRTLLSVLAEGGRLAAWKAKRDKIEAEMAGIRDLVSGYEIIPAPVPFLGHEERNLVVIW